VRDVGLRFLAREPTAPPLGGGSMGKFGDNARSPASGCSSHQAGAPYYAPCRPRVVHPGNCRYCPHRWRVVGHSLGRRHAGREILEGTGIPRTAFVLLEVVHSFLVPDRSDCPPRMRGGNARVPRGGS